MKILCKNKYWEINKECNLDKTLYLLVDRPTRFNRWNDFIWENKQTQLHRDYGLPGYISIISNNSWYENGVLIRENNKPARIFKTGSVVYYTNNKVFKKEYWQNNKLKT